MHQEVVAANCPHCGNVVEFVARLLGRKVQALFVYKAAWSGQRVNCPCCRREMVLDWRYEDEK